MNEAYKGKYTGQQIDNLLDKVSLWLKGGDSENGATFYPYVDAEGNISWENDKNLANPPSVNIIGPQGVPGPKVSILGTYNSVEELYAAHPIGNLGDSYLVNGDLYVWFPNDTTWFNVGRIQGPQGPPGEPGLAGNDGKSAYAYAQEKGYDKTEDEFAEDLSKIGDAGAATKQISGVIVLASGWVDETKTTCFWRYRIEDSRIPANHGAYVPFVQTDATEEQASSLVRATNAGVSADVTCNEGYIDIYSTSQPDTDLVCNIQLYEVKEV